MSRCVTDLSEVCWEANLQGVTAMKSKLGAVLAAAGCALALSVASAKAATITETINFTASGFQPPGAPVDPVMGSFTITLDPTVDTSFATTITFNNEHHARGQCTFLFLCRQQLGRVSYCVLTRFSCKLW